MQSLKYSVRLFCFSGAAGQEFVRGDDAEARDRPRDSAVTGDRQAHVKVVGFKNPVKTTFYGVERPKHKAQHAVSA